MPDNNFAFVLCFAPAEIAHSRKQLKELHDLLGRMIISGRCDNMELHSFVETYDKHGGVLRVETIDVTIEDLIKSGADWSNLMKYWGLGAVV